MDKPIRFLIASLLAMAVNHAAVAKGPPGPLACLIVPEKVADIGSPVIGVIESVAVDRGDVVKQGQVVARLMSDVENANERVVRSRAQAEGDLHAAVSNEALSRQQLERAEKLFKENYISEQEMDKLKSDYVIAQQKVAEAREQLRTAAHEVQLSEAQVSQRIIKSPFDGVVIERYANPGEHIDDKPLLKIANVDSLRVEVVAPIEMFGKVKVGQSAVVYAELPGAPPKVAHITQIDNVLDPASNTFRLRLDMDNADESVPAGLRCKIDLAASAEKPADGNVGMRLEPTISKASLVVQGRTVWSAPH
jgi:RND family efflux transporter MFP subunit